MKNLDLDLSIGEDLTMLGGRRNNDEEVRRIVRSNWLDRRIFKLYEFGAKWMPIPLMLTHWYGVWDYSHYPRAVVVDTSDNGHCIVWLYFLAYIYMPLALLPVSYFFHYCWLFRVPFIYFIGINAIPSRLGHLLPILGHNKAMG